MAMSSNKKILFLGGTGYIGGSVLDAILRSDKIGQLDITVYVRSPEKAKIFEEKIGLKTVTGPVSVVKETAAQVDIIINCASSDDLSLAEAFLAGAKKHYAHVRRRTIVIETSGTGIVTDFARGKFATEKIVDDSQSDVINALPATQWHRNVDVPIMNAYKEGYAEPYFVYPGIIYGLATGKIVDAGLQHPVPTYVMFMTKIAMHRGKVGVVGPQKNVWSLVDIHDTTDLYMIVFNAIIEGKQIPSGLDGHYVAENGNMVVKEYQDKVAKCLHELGVFKTADASEFLEEELQGFWIHFGSNSLASSSRSRSLGWKPTRPTQDFVDDMKKYLTVFFEMEKTR